MVYVATDPRSRLSTATGAKATDFAGPQIGRHYEEKPQVVGPNYRQWLTRGENFLSAYTEVMEGAVLERKNQVDEYMILMLDEQTEMDIEWNGTTTPCKGEAVVFVPAGNSTIKVKQRGRLAMWFTTRNEDLVKKCKNAEGYEKDPNVPPLVDWPAPKGGPKVRYYPLKAVPKQEGRLGRIFRSTTFMVNWPTSRPEPRDVSKMSPHSHDDHQQCSLIFAGNYIHHMRWPWISDKNKWRPEVHEVTAAPSVTFIPARCEHTSEYFYQTFNGLIDIFCPPREDFSKQAGWVLNADEYPNPDHVKVGSGGPAAG